jgi:hypothetical protein
MVHKVSSSTFVIVVAVVVVAIMQLNLYNCQWSALAPLMIVPSMDECELSLPLRIG